MLTQEEKDWAHGKGRPKQILPTQAETNLYIKTLKAKAEAGDVQAITALAIIQVGNQLTTRLDKIEKALSGE